MSVLQEIRDKFRPRNNYDTKQATLQDTFVTHHMLEGMEVLRNRVRIPFGISGIPINLELDNYGSEIRIAGISEDGMQQETADLLIGENYRLFIVPECKIQELYSKRDLSASDVFFTLKQTDIGGRDLLQFKPLTDIREPYYIIAKWVMDPNGTDRSMTPDVFRLRVDPESKKIRQIFTEQLVPITLGQGIRVGLLTQDARLMVGTQGTVWPNENCLVLQDYADPKHAEFGFVIVQSGSGLEVVVKRPERILVKQRERTVDMTPDADRLQLSHGYDGVVYNGEDFVCPEGQELRVPIIFSADNDNTQIAFEITNRTNSILRRVLAEFHMIHNESGVVLMWTANAERGTFQSMSGSGQIIYAYQAGLELRRKTSGMPDGRKAADTTNSEVPQEDGLARLRRENLEELEKLQKKFPGCYNQNNRVRIQMGPSTHSPTVVV